MTSVIDHATPECRHSVSVPRAWLNPGRLSGSYPLAPNQEAHKVLEGVAEALAVSAQCIRIEQDSTGMAFELDRGRWLRARALLGLSPVGGRIRRGDILLQGDRLVFDVQLSWSLPLMIAGMWTLALLAVASVTSLALSLGLIVGGLAALRFMLRQSESEWLHQIITDGLKRAGPPRKPVRG